MPLQSKFLSQLDAHSERLISLFKKRGGQIGKRLASIMAAMAEDDDVDLGRECIIKALCVYLNEDPENLVREYVAADEALIQGSIEETTVGIYAFKQREADIPDNIGIVLEGQVVLQELDNVALAAAMLFGLMFALNLDYPPELRTIHVTNITSYGNVFKEVMTNDKCSTDDRCTSL
ncbi:hypothetical protein SRHO_G00306310 [Serrasalmus rhombeus]